MNRKYTSPNPKFKFYLRFLLPFQRFRYIFPDDTFTELLVYKKRSDKFFLKSKGEINFKSDFLKKIALSNLMKIELLASCL